MNPKLAFLVAVAIVVALAEAAILYAITSHPASSRDGTAEGFEFLVGWAAAPLVASIVLALVLVRQGRAVPVRGFSVALLSGVALGGLGLVQYGHSTPGFLMLAFLVQCCLLLVWARRAWRHAT